MTIHDRLRQARLRAGFDDATKAAAHFGWKYPTYSSHENGHRGIKDKDVEKYAAALNVSPEWLHYGEKAPARPAAKSPPGFSEPDVTPYYAPTDTLRLSIERLAAAIAPDTRSFTLYQLQRDYPTLMLLKNDVLIVDQNTLAPPQGEIVVSQVADEARDAGRTCLRIQSKDGPMPPFAEPGLSKTEIEAAVGTVVASMRPKRGATV